MSVHIWARNSSDSELSSVEMSRISALDFDHVYQDSLQSIQNCCFLDFLTDKPTVR